MAEAMPVPVRCSEWTRERQVDPIGSIKGSKFILVIEWPLPWPHDVAEIPELAELHREVVAAGGRLQCVVPPRDATVRRVTVHHLVQDDHRGIGPFQRTESTAADTELVTVARQILRSPLPKPKGVPTMRYERQDVLICGHGRRDRCCGSKGTALERTMQSNYKGLTAQARITRTSHLGGHRFAPTALVLPQGTAWAFLDSDALARIIRRSGPVEDLLPRYRGFAGHAVPAAQVLDRFAFAEVGWDWLDHKRGAEVLSEGELRLRSIDPDGNRCMWQGIVGVRRTMPIPECGEPVERAKKASDEFELIAARRIS